MIQIQIEDQLLERCPDICLGAIQCDVTIQEKNDNLWEEIDRKIQQLEQTLTLKTIREIPSIQTSKKGYKRIGKDPNRYRLSAEALLRRVVNKKGLYKINNVVDLLNLVSIDSGFSIGGYNVEKIEGNILFGVGKANEDYTGIGRGKLNIENLPVFRDLLGAFGSPTSDSIRTQIDKNCKQFLMIIVSFQKKEEVEKTMNNAIQLLEKYANGKNFENTIFG
jgi:DNA/RNA-binding domain of Phe-tRNA-synthetase-like protein